MFERFYAQLLGISTKTLHFISENPRRFRVRMLIVIPIVAWTALLYQISPLFIKWQVDSLENDWTRAGGLEFDSVIPVLVFIIISYLGLKLLDALLQFFKESILYSFDRQSEEDLEQRFKQFAEQFDSSFLGGHNNMRLLRNLQSEARDIRSKFSELQVVLIEIPVGFIALASILPILHPVLLIIILVSASISLYVEYSQGNAWRKTEFLESRYAIQSTDLLHQMYTKINVLVNNGWLNRYFDLYKIRRRKWNRVRNHQNTQDKLFDLITTILSAITEAAATIVGGLMVLADLITLGTFAVLNDYVVRVKSLILSAGDLLRLIIELRYILTRLDFLLTIQPRISHDRDQQKIDIESVERIELDDIIYSYPDISKEEYEYLKTIQRRFGLEKSGSKWYTLTGLKEFITSTYLAPGQKKILREEFGAIESGLETGEKSDTNVFCNFSYTFEKGLVYHIDGLAGSGKSTLVNMIKHSLKPDSGEIRVTVIDSSQEKHVLPLDQMSPLSWKPLIGAVVNDTTFWSSFTVREIMSFGLPLKMKFTDDQIIDALDKVGIELEPKNLDEIISETVDFSDGEKVLFGFARILLQPKPLIFIDESIIHVKGVQRGRIESILDEVKKNSIIIIESSVIPDNIMVNKVIEL